MTRRSKKMVLCSLLAGLAVSIAAPVLAAPIPSKSVADDAAARDASLASVKSFLAREDVSRALQVSGLTPAQADERLSRLSDEDLRSLARNLDQVQAAGTDVPDYVWILLAVFLGVLILAAIF
jgi:hypothetical protein